MNRITRLLLLFVFLTLPLSWSATASAPRLISFQGQLTDSVDARLIHVRRSRYNHDCEMKTGGQPLMMRIARRAGQAEKI